MRSNARAKHAHGDIVSSSLTALVLALLSLAFTASALAFAVRQLRALAKVTPRALDRELLVVVPARNESKRLRPTLASLRGATVVVVDDRSSDDTAAVAASFENVRVLPLHDDPPAGVFGKPRALQAAVDDAKARDALPELVLFLDADVVLADGALGGIVDALGDADALSGVPSLTCESAVEAMLVPALASVVTGRFAPSRVHDESDATAFLNGQLLLVKTAALDEIGGWAAVSSTVLEDVALAKLLKARGKKLRLADLRAVASTRMYDSLHAIDEGFGKNATALLGNTAGLVGVFAFLTSLLPWSALALSPTLPVALVVAAVLLLQATTRKLAGAPLWPVLVLPLVYLGVAVVLVRASLRKTVTWRGRRYSR